MARRSLVITASLLSEEDLAYCAALPNFMIRHGCRFVHGCPPESIITYLWDPSEERLHRLFLGFSERICFFGHTHILSCYIKGKRGYEKPVISLGSLHLHPENRYMINAGSVGQPRDDIDNRAKYGILDTLSQTLTYRAVAYDVDKTIELIGKRGLPEINALRLR